MYKYKEFLKALKNARNNNERFILRRKMPKQITQSQDETIALFKLK